MTRASRFARRLRALVLQRCPRCCEGRVFSGSIAMLEDCPRCGLHFGREPGYFFGAMYFSYGIAVVVLTILLFLVHLVAPDLSDMKKTVIAWIAFWPFVPATFRYSRTFWMHFDRSFDEPTRTVLPLVEARARDD